MGGHKRWKYMIVCVQLKQDHSTAALHAIKCERVPGREGAHMCHNECLLFYK